MQVEDFNISKGIYVFNVPDFETGFHSHPALEIVIAKRGKFALAVGNSHYENIRFACIEANKKHKLIATGCLVKIIMIEHHKAFIGDYLKLDGVQIEDGCFLQTKVGDKERIIDKALNTIRFHEIKTDYDQRVWAMINHCNGHSSGYGRNPSLNQLMNLSESRVSHLFKDNVGISLKKYLVWTKLKATIIQHLNSPSILFDSLIDNGFYDQPHFVRHFKNTFGVKPTLAYNSRTVQLFPVKTG